MKVPRWTFGHLHSTKPSFLQTSPSRLLFHQPLVHPRPRSPLPLPVYSRSSSSSTRWKARQSRDSFASRARLQDLKSRAAFKLLELNEKHRIFRSGNTVVDLGYAPGSWSQIAVNRTQPNGRVVGIDVIPAQPPKGVSTIQGNFLSPEVQAEVRRYVLDPARGRARKRRVLSRTAEHEEDMATEEDLEQEGMAYIDLERRAQLEGSDDALEGKEAQHGADRAEKKMTTRQRDDAEGRVVDVVLSDMSEPWSPPAGLWKNSLSNPYFRMMNTSGLAVRDHAGSMVRENCMTLFWMRANSELGSLHGSPDVLLRCAQDGWAFCLQVLPRV